MRLTNTTNPHINNITLQMNIILINEIVILFIHRNDVTVEHLLNKIIDSIRPLPTCGMLTDRNL